MIILIGRIFIKCSESLCDALCLVVRSIWNNKIAAFTICNVKNLFQFSALYLGSLGFIILGVIVYNLKPTPSQPSLSGTQSLSYRRIEEDSQPTENDSAASSSSSSSLVGHMTNGCCQELRMISL